MAIEMAPAAVAIIALFFASQGQIATPITLLAGYGILMVAAQLPLLPRYLKLTFSSAPGRSPSPGRQSPQPAFSG